MYTIVNGAKIDTLMSRLEMWFNQTEENNTL